jgi:hypothetical protein
MCQFSVLFACGSLTGTDGLGLVLFFCSFGGLHKFSLPFHFNLEIHLKAV